jgi:hypothetical protein
MLFREKDDSPGFPYPHALPSTGWAAAYPISGEYSTNPNYYSREVMRTRTSRRIPIKGTPIGQTFMNSDESFMRHQQNICKWLAQFWDNELTGADHNDWYQLQLTAQHSHTAPVSWDGSYYLTHGWALFFLINKVTALFLQPFSSGVNFSLTPPQPKAPALWNPYRLSNFAVWCRLSAPYTQLSYLQTPAAGKYITLYSTKPRRQAGPFGNRPMLQLSCLYALAGGTFVNWTDWNRAFPHARAGQYVTFGIRVSRTDNHNPSNLLTYTTIIDP